MFKRKEKPALNADTASSAPTELQTHDPAQEMQVSSAGQEKKKHRGGCALLAIIALIGVLVLVGVIFFREKVADYFPTEWVKKEISINSGLPQKDKDAVNAIFQDLVTRLDQDKPSVVKDPKTIDNYDYLANLPASLRKYKRLSLLKLLDAIKEDIGKSGIFVRRDFFLPYFDDAEVLQWEVQYNKSNNAEFPSYHLVARIRNSTGVAISKVLLEIDSSGFNAAGPDSLAVQTPFRQVFTLLPAERIPVPQFEAFHCPISAEEFDMLNGRSGAAKLLKVFLMED